MSDFDDDDLDALCNECLDTLDEQERVKNEKEKQREAELQEICQKVEQQENAAAGDQENMMKMFQSILAGGANGNLDENAFVEFQRQVGGLVSSLEGVSDLTEADRANLQRVKDLMSVMDSNDEQKAQELLAEINKETGVQPEGGSIEETMKRLQDTMGELSKLDGLDGPLPPAANATGSAACPPPPAPAAASASAASDPDQIPEGLTTMLIETLTNPDFVKPIQLMRDSYDAWIEAHKATLSAAELERITKQHEKSKEICEFLAVPLNKEDDERMAKMLDLMHQFSELGEPPSDLSSFAPGGVTADTAE